MSLRAAALRTALERALDDPVHVLSTNDGIRIHAPAPPPEDQERWERVHAALRTADRYGSAYTPTGPEVWADIHNEAGTTEYRALLEHCSECRPCREKTVVACTEATRLRRAWLKAQRSTDGGTR